tara:strand:- start:2489 stop:2884 length:396 start_codon:yes stop_codon:yes gene_type:complete
MDMKKIMKGYREAIPEYDDRALQEVETREGFRNYKITVYVKIDKKANIDVRQVFGKIRAIAGVTTLKQEKAIADRVSYWLCEVTIKFNTQGMANKNYIYDILVRQINSEMELKGIPGAKVYGINWQSFAEI